MPAISEDTSTRKPGLLILGALPPPLHGAAVYYQNLIAHGALHEAFRVHFINLNLRNVLGSYQKFSLRKVLRSFLFLAEHLKILISQRIDLVYAGMAFPKYPFLKDSVFVMLARLFRKEIVGCVVGMGLKKQYRRSSWLMKRYYRFVGRLYAGFITPGLEMSRADFSSIFPTDRIIGVPFGVHPVLENRRPVKPSFDVHNVLYMSNFLPAKGVFDVLKSIKTVRRRQSNVKFIFSGDWMTREDEAEAKRIIEEDRISDQVEFVGVIGGQKKRDILADSEIFLLPTYYEYEGLPLALLEAMSCGLFIITTDHSAIGDVIKEGTNGLFCRNKDPDDLAQKIVMAIENEELSYRIRARNQEEFYRSYTYDKYIENLVITLRGLCS